MDSVRSREAAAAAEELLSSLGVHDLPVDVFQLAEGLGVAVVEKPDADSGVSGALVKLGNSFSIAYATHIKSPGFQRFSVGHELGHLNIPGHAEALLPTGDGVHQSRAHFRSGDTYEREADEFSANLLMPRDLFKVAMRSAGNGLAAILKLTGLCETSLLATAIRYVGLTDEAMAVVVSEGQTLRYAFLSDELKEFRALDWPGRNSPLPNVATATFNEDTGNVMGREQAEYETPMADWFGGQHSATLSEEVIGLGQYGRTLTVLTSDIPADEDDEDADLEDSWTPRFRR